jgi:NADP-dependent 3-hydroxy acid dehydrogenase YdfG
MTVFITGATAGFGKATAEKFAFHHHHLIIAGRRKERLFQLANDLQNKYSINVLPLVLDVRNRQEVFAAIASLSKEWQTIDVLLNNAGLALGRDSFENAALDDWETMLDTNVKGMMFVTKAVLPLMIAAGKGHIINLGSIAAKEVYPGGNGYNTSKFAVNALSQSMRIDLLPHHIKVTCIHPGAAETEFSLVRFKGDEQKAATVYEGFTPLTANDIADAVYYCATTPPHVCINDLVIMPTAQANATLFYKK